MKKIVVLIVFVLSFSSVAFSYPTIIPDATKTHYSESILVYSSDKINMFISKDDVVFNLSHTTFPENGKFLVTLYIEGKSEEWKSLLFDRVKKEAESNRIVLLAGSNPRYVTYYGMKIFYDSEKQKTYTSSEAFYDSRFNLIGWKDVSIWESVSDSAILRLAVEAVSKKLNEEKDYYFNK